MIKVGPSAPMCAISRICPWPMPWMEARAARAPALPLAVALPPLRLARRAGAVPLPPRAQDSPSPRRGAPRSSPGPPRTPHPGSALQPLHGPPAGPLPLPHFFDLLYQGNTPCELRTRKTRRTTITVISIHNLRHNRTAISLRLRLPRSSAPTVRAPEGEAPQPHATSATQPRLFSPTAASPTRQPHPVRALGPSCAVTA